MISWFIYARLCWICQKRSLCWFSMFMGSFDGPYAVIKVKIVILANHKPFFWGYTWRNQWEFDREDRNLLANPISNFKILKFASYPLLFSASSFFLFFLFMIQTTLFIAAWGSEFVKLVLPIHCKVCAFIMPNPLFDKHRQYIDYVLEIGEKSLDVILAKVFLHQN